MDFECGKCKKKLEESEVLPGMGVEYENGTVCYECYYKDQGWDLETCVDCGRGPMDGIAFTMDGPLCEECNPGGEIDPPPEGVDLPPGVGFPVSESVMGNLVSSFMSGMFDRMGSRERIAAIMMAAHRAGDIVSAAIANMDSDAGGYSTETSVDLAKNAVEDADALIKALRSSKGDKNENGEVQ